MTDREKEIAEKYMLPEHPFLYGMASAFDMFGVLNEDRWQRIRASCNRSRQPNVVESLDQLWRDVGEILLWAADEYDKEERQGNTGER